MPYCNTHIRSPYSFGTAATVDELVREGVRNDVAVLGINDDVSIDGFREFAESCRTNHIFPLFNITLLVRCSFEHHAVHEMHPPVEEYPCRLLGKALRFPTTHNSDSRNLLASLWKASQDRIWKRIDRLNTLLEQLDSPRRLEYTTIRSRYAKSAVYEHHLALALYDLLTAETQPARVTLEQCKKIFNNGTLDGNPADRTSFLRTLLKQLTAATSITTGTSSAELTIPLSQAKQVILQSGGIPCFHCSFNDHDEWMKESKGPGLLAQQLSSRGIHMVEFIPGETSIDLLRTFMRHLYNNNFCITMGTGGTGWPEPVFRPVCNDGTAPDDDLLAMSYEGACVLAAHQEMHLQKRRGFVDESGKRLVPPDRLKEFITLGDQVIRAAVNR